MLRKERFTEGTGFLNISCVVRSRPRAARPGERRCGGEGSVPTSGEGRVGITDTAAIPAGDGLNAVDGHNFMFGFIFLEKVK